MINTTAFNMIGAVRYGMDSEVATIQFFTDTETTITDRNTGDCRPLDLAASIESAPVLDDEESDILALIAAFSEYTSSAARCHKMMKESGIDLEWT